MTADKPRGASLVNDYVTPYIVDTPETASHHKEVSSNSSGRMKVERDSYFLNALSLVRPRSSSMTGCPHVYPAVFDSAKLLLIQAIKQSQVEQVSESRLELLEELFTNVTLVQDQLKEGRHTTRTADFRT